MGKWEKLDRRVGKRTLEAEEGVGGVRGGLRPVRTCPMIQVNSTWSLFLGCGCTLPHE